MINGAKGYASASASASAKLGAIRNAFSSEVKSIRNVKSHPFKELRKPVDQLKLHKELGNAVATAHSCKGLTKMNNISVGEWVVSCEDFNSIARSQSYDSSDVLLRNLDQALIRLQPTKGRTYRVTEDDGVFGSKINKGDIVLDKGYMASSSSCEFVKTFYPRESGKTYFVIDGNSGVNISSFRSDQAEFLFPRQQAFRVKDVIQDKSNTFVHLVEDKPLAWKGIKNIHTGDEYLREIS